MKWNFASNALSSVFAKLGGYVAEKPLWFIIIPFIFSIILISGFYRVRYEQNIDYLYNPDNSQSYQAVQIAESLFRMNYSSKFNIGKIARLANVGAIVITANDGGSVLRKEIIKDIVEIDEIIKNISIQWKNETLRYSSLCAKTGKKCFRNELLVHADRISNIHSGYRIIKYPLTRSGYSFIPYNLFLGGVSVDELDYVTSAQAIRLAYILDATESNREKNTAWENAFLDIVADMQYDNLTLYRFAFTSISRELTRTAITVIPFYGALISIMLIFSFITCSTRDCVISKPWLGVVGCISVALALGCSFGFVFYCGFPFIDISLAVPFLMLGIGMDDTFIMLATWRHSESKKFTKDRISKTYSEAAVSITITSLTNLVCFCIGLATPFPAIKIFCFFASTSVVMCYIFQLTFFGGWLSLFGYAEEKNLHSLFFSKVNPEGHSKYLKQFLFYRRSDNKASKSITSTYFWTTVGKTIENKFAKAIILVIFLISLTMGIYFSTKLKEGVYIQMFFPFDSYASDFFNADIKYFSKYKNRIQIMVNTPLNYADPSVRQRIENMLNEMESNKYMANSYFTESWLREYLKFQKDIAASLFLLKNYNLSCETDFNLALRDVFFQIPETKEFKNDVVFNENGTKIMAARFLIQSNITYSVEDEKQALVEIREIAKKYPYDVHLLHYMFVYLDQFLLVGKIAFQAIAVATFVMICIFLVFIPNIACTILAGFTIISIEISVIGYIALWDIHLDTVSMLNLIICIGFSIDYAAHISHAYIISRKKSKDHRIQLTLRHVGMPVFQGSVSTILGIIVLVFAPAYVFLCFFKIVFLVILLAALHALFLLPVLLSLAESISQTCFFKKEKERTLSKKRMLPISFKKSDKITDEYKSDNEEDDDLGIEDP